MDAVADAAQEAMLARLASLGFQWRNGDGVPYVIPPLVTVPAGPFRLGSDKARDTDARSDETNRIVVDLPAFQIGRFPVTVTEYACFVRALVHAGRETPLDASFRMGWKHQLRWLDHPVTTVSWYNAYDYAAWLAERTGQPWRLPTEAEWEKAARSDPRDPLGPSSERIYPWGDVFDFDRCNVKGSLRNGESAIGEYGPDTPGPRFDQRFFRQSGASPCGVEEMAGNVSEWTASPYARNYSKANYQADRHSDEERSLRGGSRRHGPREARAACRYNVAPFAAHHFYGFRLVLAAADA